jgi:hypothetical protein
MGIAVETVSMRGGIAKATAEAPRFLERIMGGR